MGDNEKVTKIQCAPCQGIGLVKSEIELCDNCQGKKCMFCAESGYKSQPWILCQKCYGDGEIIKKKE
jgi:DnaJ-class molecular chaperone